MGNQLRRCTPESTMLCSWVHGLLIYNTGRKRVALGFEVQGLWVLTRIFSLTLAKLLVSCFKEQQGSSTFMWPGKEKHLWPANLCHHWDMGLWAILCPTVPTFILLIRCLASPSQRMCLSALLSPAHIFRARPNIDTAQKWPLAVSTSPDLQDSSWPLPWSLKRTGEMQERVTVTHLEDGLQQL